MINFSPAVNQENKGEVQNLKLTLNFLINRLEFYFIIDAFFAAHVRKSGQTVETLNFERETKKKRKNEICTRITTRHDCVYVNREPTVRSTYLPVVGLRFRFIL